MSTPTFRGVAVLALLAALVTNARGEPDAEIEVRAALRFEAPEIDGTLIVRWRSRDVDPRSPVSLDLPANRFRVPPEGWSDLSRHFLLAGATYRPGGTEILEAREGGRSLLTRRVGDGQRVEVDLGRDPGPGEEVILEIRFQTTLPNLLDVFGTRGDMWSAWDGWFPALAAASRPPGRLDLRAPAGSTLLVNGRPVEGARVRRRIRGGELLSILLSKAPLAAVERRVNRRRISVLSVPDRALFHRVSPYPAAADALVESLEEVLERSGGTSEIALLRAPLRWYPSASSAETIVVSDRLFDVHPLLRPFHGRELAYAVFLHEELRRAAAREPDPDATWIAEGLAWRRAEAFHRDRFREGREVRDWIRLFDVFAVVDRFDTAPRVPFLRVYFPVLTSDDPLALRPGAAGERPPGRFLFSRLEERLRPDRFESLLERYESGSETFREALRAVGGGAGESFLDAWLAPAPGLNYAVEAAGRDPQRARFRIVREGSDPRPATLEVELAERDGAERIFVDVDRPEVDVDQPTRSEVHSIRLDPDRRHTEPRLDDNRAPAEVHVLLDSADVEVSSTEFGFATLLVGRRRYDYRKDLAAAGFVTNRGYGANVGFQLHGGPRIDENLFRRNLFAYYSLQELDETFRNERVPELRTAGRLGGFGFRYNDFDAFWFESPSRSRHLRLFFDVYDGFAGSDFDYLQAGASLAATAAIRDDTVLAVQMLNGFSVETGRGGLPNQGLFSLGGFRSIRGIGAEEELAGNILVFRAELRKLLPVRLDLNFQDVLVARRLGLRLFVDAGRVDDDRGRLYDPGEFAVGAGGGFNLFYDFLGFFPTSFYLDVGTRLDRRGSPQVLFGARQPF